ncbi:MAG: Smr/MutS family protein [Vicinamibacterales bacterium]
MLDALPKALEFDRILAVLSQFAVTPLGRNAAAELEPQTDPAAIRRDLALTLEMVRLLDASSGLPLRASDDLPAALDALGIEGRALEAVRLLALADCVESIERSAHLIRREDPRAPTPLLRELAGRVASFAPEVARVRRAIDAGGEVLDDASADLKSVRERLRRQRSRLRSALESYLRSKDTSKYLQEQVVTDRNGRYVLVVRAEHRSAIPGIVHGASTSGASLYLEPLSTVDVNNDIVALEEQEAEEVRRILRELTDLFRARAGDLASNLDIGERLDLVQAKARFAQLIEGVAPEVSSDGRIELRSARHPLLIPGVTARLARVDPDTAVRTEPPVAVDIELTPPTRVLVITGPNTGGKTVALKTTGLMALMAQAGLLVSAAAGSTLPVFQSVFADIGDDQSIAASLSTFSSHIANIATMDRAMTLPALILLDEAGTGTDPVEGGALATAVIDHFRRKGAFVMATTHYDALKSYASTTSGVMVASFGFDPLTFAPTYRLRYGAPGGSLALEIAGRLGLSPSIVEEARQLRTTREAQLAEHLARVDRDMQSLEHERRIVARERAQQAAHEAQLQTRDAALRQREELSRKRLDEALHTQLREARREIDEAVETLKKRTEVIAKDVARRTFQAPALSTGDTGALRNQARDAVEQVVERHLRPSEPDHALSGRPAGASLRLAGVAPAPGARVAVGPLGLEGTVQTIHGTDAEVLVHGKRLRVKVDTLAVLQPSTAPARVDVHVQTRDTPTTGDLNVVGRSVDEALSLADKFLDDAVLGPQRTIRLIHGHGKGHLKRALAAFLEDHPQVASFGPAPPEQGGGGVTVVELKD